MRTIISGFRRVIGSRARRAARFALCAAFLACLTAQGCAARDNAANRIGVLMPSKKESRWAQDSDSIMRQLQAKGYEVDIKNAEDSVDIQIRQIETMIDDGCSVLVVTAIDGRKLKDVLRKAAEKKVKIIAYDRLLMDTPYVDYLATFDSYEVGVMQAKYLEDTLGLCVRSGTYNIEIFAGSPEDNNSKYLYDGAMSVLRPYIDGGTLVVTSGEADNEAVSTQGWNCEAAQARMGRLLNDHYNDGTELHAILSPNDGLSIGIIKALKLAGYGSKKPYPLLTGQDCALENVIAMLNGEQSMSVFKDTRVLADRTVRMIDDLLLGTAPEVNDEKTFFNGVKKVPAYMCKPVYADRESYKRVLIDSGYYEDSDIYFGVATQ